MAQPQNNTFKQSTDQSANLSNEGLQWVDIYHVPTGYSVNFKAMMTEFSDAYATEWSSENVFGRMDPISIYQRTGRTISVAFDVVAGSLAEAIDNLTRISTFVQFLYPSYDAGGLMKNSPFCKIQFLNWAASSKSGNFSIAKNSGLMGTINGFTFSPNLDVGVFVGDDKMLYPKILNVSFALVVLHDHPLGWSGKSSMAGNKFPYLENIGSILKQKGDGAKKFPAPVNLIQKVAVPNDVKEEATVKEMTRPAGMSAKREAELRKLGHSAHRIRSGAAEKDQAELEARSRRVRIARAKRECGDNNWMDCYK